MLAQIALAALAIAMLPRMAHEVAAEPVAPEHRLRIAGWLFHQATTENARGDHSLARQNYHIAAAEYQKLADEGYDHPDLYLNLGNAHLLAGELPQAILAYHRGLHQHPLHEQLWESLDAARDVVAYPDDGWRQRPAGDHWPPWLPRPAPASLMHTALGLYVLAWLAVAAWLVVRRRWTAIVAILLFLACSLPAAGWGYLDYRIAQEDEQALVIVAVNGVTLRRGNGALYAQHSRLPVVNRGMEARLLSERGGWVQVQFPGGDVGWLPRGAVLVDERG
jgi:tetratricopeptide (TPR) repeat protein